MGEYWTHHSEDGEDDRSPREQFPSDVAEYNIASITHIVHLRMVELQVDKQLCREQTEDPYCMVIPKAPS